MKKHLEPKDLGVAYSLANLWFISVWRQFIYTTDKPYFDFEPRRALEYLAVFVDVLLLAAIFLIIINLSRSAVRPWLRRTFQILFLVTALLAFGSLSSELFKWILPGTLSFVNLPIPILVLAICILLAVKDKFRLHAITQNLRLLILFLLPFSLLIFFQLFYEKLNTDPNILLPQSVENVIAPNEGSPLSKKIVWIIFDELDYSAFTTARLNNIELPDFDRLINQSLVAQNALPPHYFTLKSIPALLTGKPLRTLRIAAPNDLTLFPLDNSEPFSLRRSDNVFSQLKNAGGKSAIVGWYHPYPRIFQDTASYVYWRTVKTPHCNNFFSFATCNLNIFIRSLLSVPFLVRLFPSLWTAEVVSVYEDRDAQIERNRFLTDKANELIANPNLNLLFFHFSIPHAPNIARVDLDGRETYFNSLEVANDTIKRLRETLEKNNQWDQTVVIVSSDHWWRFKEAEDFDYLPDERKEAALSDHRVPFIIKFANQKKRIDYQQFFNTIVTKELILNMFNEKIKTPEDFQTWLDRLRADRPEFINHQPEPKKAFDY